MCFFYLHEITITHIIYTLVFIVRSNDYDLLFFFMSGGSFKATETFNIFSRMLSSLLHSYFNTPRIYFVEHNVIISLHGRNYNPQRREQY